MGKPVISHCGNGGLQSKQNNRDSVSSFLCILKMVCDGKRKNFFAPNGSLFADHFGNTCLWICEQNYMR